MRNRIIISLLALVTAVLVLASCAAKNDGPETTIVREKSFIFVVVDEAGKDTTFEVKSHAKTVGEALVEERLIEGEEGPYGLYVKKVNGIEADYDKTGNYWAFYAGGELAPRGVDQTEIVDGETYAFKVEK